MVSAIRSTVFVTTALISIVTARSVSALTDDEPGNDALETAAIQLLKAGAVTTAGGKLSLIPGDTDYVGIGELNAADIVTISTTPLDDSPFLEDPDTMVGLFDASGTMLCLGDDAFNNDLDYFPLGRGSLCRFEVEADGEYFVGVTGYSLFAFDGYHFESGDYELSIAVTGPGASTPPTTFSDDEPVNDTLSTATAQLVKTDTVTVKGGKLSLSPGDFDYVGIGELNTGDIVTISTTPLDDPPFLEDPDTMVGLFDASGSMLCLGDDAFNNDLDFFPIGFGSLCRFEIGASGEYFAGVTGFSSNPFDGFHAESGDYQLAVSVTTFQPPFIPVVIDIKPGSNPNAINPSLAGDLPVAIFGSDVFDVANSDVETLSFGPSGASLDHDHGPHFEDTNGDGFTDLIAHFRVEEAGIAFGDLETCITGETLDGTPFQGCDSMRTVPDMDGDALLDVEEAAIGTSPVHPDTDKDGFDDRQEVDLMGTDPLDPFDPEPTPVPEPAARFLVIAGATLLGSLVRIRRKWCAR